jgi:cytochrome c
MRRTLVLVVLLVFAAATLTIAQDQKAEQKKAMKDSFMRGKELFMDASLGTNGKSCNTCHASGGTEAGKMGDKEVPPFMHIGKKYPGYFSLADRNMTIDQVIDFCIVNAMEGKALPWDDQRMTDLATYVEWVGMKTGMENKEMMEHEGMMHKEHMKDKTKEKTEN